MEITTPRYIIVSFLHGNPPASFGKSMWPLHATIVRPFYLSADPVGIIRELEKLCKGKPEVSSKGIRRSMFGERNDIPVTEIELVTGLDVLHKQLTNIVQTWTDTVDKSFPVYSPHVSDQDSGSLRLGVEVTIDSVSLVRMDTDERVVLSTVRF